MNKLLLTLTAILLFMTTVKAQEGFNLGIVAGFPFEPREQYTFSVGIDTGYLFALGEKVDVGMMTGYLHSFGMKDPGYEVEDFQYIPLAAAVRLNLNKFTAGLDIGYAHVLNENANGTFYAKPHVGFNINERIQLHFSPRFLIYGGTGDGTLDHNGDDFSYDGFDGTYIIFAIGGNFNI